MHDPCCHLTTVLLICFQAGTTSGRRGGSSSIFSGFKSLGRRVSTALTNRTGNGSVNSMFGSLWGGEGGKSTKPWFGGHNNGGNGSGGDKVTAESGSMSGWAGGKGSGHGVSHTEKVRMDNSFDGSAVAVVKIKATAHSAGPMAEGIRRTNTDDMLMTDNRMRRLLSAGTDSYRRSSSSVLPEPAAVQATAALARMLLPPHHVFPSFDIDPVISGHSIAPHSAGHTSLSHSTGLRNRRQPGVLHNGSTWSVTDDASATASGTAIPAEDFAWWEFYDTLRAIGVMSDDVTSSRRYAHWCAACDRVP